MLAATEWLEVGPMSEAHDQPMDGADLVRRWVQELFNERNLSVVEDLMADVYVEHAVAPFGTEEPGPMSGPDGMRRTVVWLTDQFPDVHMTIEALVAQGDLVACRVLSTGTNLGRLNGVMPPTGKTFSARQTHWFRVEEGRLAEHWATREDLPTMIQLGVIAPPGRPA
jgi:predicted ester cyclase